MSPNSDPLKRAQTHISNAKRIVFFTGAGMSAESGIPTFRDALAGLWARYDPEQLATPQGFLHDPSLVWGWYEWRRMRALQAVPNAGHVAIAEFAARHRPSSTDVAINVITQNVDNLHERACTIEVTHLHGSLFEHRCFRCASPARTEDINENPDEPEGGRRIDPPRCRHCNDLIRPGVVWFGEALPKASFDRATALVDECDVLVVVGTSGVVQPAANLVSGAIAMNKAVIVVDPHAPAWQNGVLHLCSTAASAVPMLLTAPADTTAFASAHKPPYTADSWENDGFLSTNEAMLRKVKRETNLTLFKERIRPEQLPDPKTRRAYRRWLKAHGHTL